MNLNRLKPAWQQYKLEKGLDQLEGEAILAIIEGPEAAARHPLNTVGLINGLLLCFMMVCCQGG